jgi:integrase
MFTVRHLIDSFSAHMQLMVRAGNTAPATLRWYRDQLRPLEPLGGYPAEALRTHHLAAIDLTNGFTRAIKRLYKWGVAEDLVPRDPFAKLTITPCGRRERTLTRAEVCQLYRAAPRALRLLLFVQLRTIARPGEIRNLTWGQILWDERVIALTTFKGQKRRRDKQRVRAIPLPVYLVRLLRNLHRKSADPSPAGRVFIAKRGEPWTANGFRCAMRRTRKAAGLDVGDEPVVAYHLRHTGATDAIRADVPIKLVAEMMGHARTSTTERYLHLDTSDIVSAIDRVTARPRTTRPAAG